MNSKYPDIEQMRKAWMEMGKALGRETQPGDPDDMNRKNTDLDKLRTRYMLGRDWSVVGGIILILVFLWVPWLNDEYRLPLAISSCGLMSANAYALNWLWKETGKINPLAMSITQVSSMARHCKKCHLLYILIGFPVTMLWIGYFIYAVQRSEFKSIEGLVMGSIIGGIFGLYSLWQDLKDYRNLSE